MSNNYFQFFIFLNRLHFTNKYIKRLHFLDHWFSGVLVDREILQWVRMNILYSLYSPLLFGYISRLNIINIQTLFKNKIVLINLFAFYMCMNIFFNLLTIVNFCIFSLS